MAIFFGHLVEGWLVWVMLTGLVSALGYVVWGLCDAARWEREREADERELAELPYRNPERHPTKCPRRRP